MGNAMGLNTAGSIKSEIASALNLHYAEFDLAYATKGVNIIDILNTIGAQTSGFVRFKITSGSMKHTGSISSDQSFQLGLTSATSSTTAGANIKVGHTAMETAPADASLVDMSNAYSPIMLFQFSRPGGRHYNLVIEDVVNNYAMSISGPFQTAAIDSESNYIIIAKMANGYVNFISASGILQFWW